ncbi:hypothetical protein CSW25_10850 [Thermus scotoductus]|uniref:Cytochrome-c oxidase n=1 Tax=Thermus scotoductus TaxID=37636 RepID=A0A430S4U8_THESC|nr:MULTISPECIES: hypothetical protein [Thermus]RTG92663.1 hypothetical protein CSW48_12440 [Thermus scotoductus]RTH06058.1 hypothetical protein CSW46_13415 [Thermus scotoductus]RTH08036.1 hypothetical protein CSW44_13045 [Thermus scotoductus]RTH10217.1 hypothetical protein CSW43_09660 [Thermus scotoductus]RTH14625.1 hypothetical protein CSW39_13640 [Thermus scotoductus]
MILASRLALTTALLWFVAANLVGLLLGLGVLPYNWRPAHAHMQLLGFVTLMIYGVAYHALPRFRGVVFRRPGLALFQVGLANLGLLGMALAWGLGLGTGIWGAFAALSLAAGLLFTLLALEILWG